MKLGARLLVLAAVFLAASGSQDGVGFHPGYLVVGRLAIYTIALLLFLVQLCLCIVAIVVMREHRHPYIALFPAIMFYILFCAATIAQLAVFNESIPTTDRPASLPASLGSVATFAYNWSITLIFASALAFLWDRESCIYFASGDVRRSRLAVAVHCALLLLMFVFGTAAAGAWAEAQKNDIATGELSVAGAVASAHDISMFRGLRYTFEALVYLSSIDLFVTTLLLSQAAKQKGLSDEITRVILVGVVPIYAVLNVARIVLLVVQSPSGLAGPASARATLSDDVIMNIFNFAIVSIFLSMCLRRPGWTLMSNDQQLQQNWAKPITLTQQSHHLNHHTHQKHAPINQKPSVLSSSSQSHAADSYSAGWTLSSRLSQASDSLYNALPSWPLHPYAAQLPQQRAETPSPPAPPTPPPPLASTHYHPYALSTPRPADSPVSPPNVERPPSRGVSFVPMESESVRAPTSRFRFGRRPL